ncbi:MAG: L-threonylcarbamoyladenylate synthase [Aureispira sp.]
MDWDRESQRLAAQMEQGNLILYPTETIWGIGCDATNEEAVKRIDLLKQRQEGKNYILLIDTIERLEEYVTYIPPKASKLIAYHARPLTIIYENIQNLPTSLLAADGSIAIRVTKDPFCKALVADLGKPIVSTSANTSGQPYPKQFSEIAPQIIEGVEGIAQYRQEEVTNQTPSTVVKVVDGQDLIFIRK